MTTLYAEFTAKQGRAGEDAFKRYINMPYGAACYAKLNNLTVEPNSQLTFLAPLSTTITSH